jgi:polar amino acid transport system substrate-binding protein
LRGLLIFYITWLSVYLLVKEHEDEMMRRLSSWLILAALLSSPTLYAKGTITLAGDEWTPYVSNPSGGKLGFTTDIVKRVFEAEGYKVSFEMQPFTRALKLCSEGKLDFVLVMYREDADANKLKVHSEPLGSSQNKFFVKSDSSWTYTGPDSLKNQTIGVIEGYSYGDLDTFLKDPANKKSVQYMHGDAPLENNLRKLSKGRISVTVDDSLVVKATLELEKLTGAVKEAGLLGEPTPVYAGVCPQKDPAREGLGKILDSGIAKLRKTGELKKILDTYGMSDWKK